MSRRVVALASLGPPHLPGTLLAGCLIALTAGLLAGAAAARLVPEAVARRVTLGLAATGGLVVLVRSVL